MICKECNKYISPCFGYTSEDIQIDDINSAYGSIVKLRLRPNDYPEAFVKSNNVFSMHYLQLCDCGYTLSEPISANVRSK